MTEIPDAEEMVAAGATANSVDVEKMLATIKQMQAQIDALNAEKGIPSNPVEAAVVNLQTHVKARQDANPAADLTELSTALNDAVNAVQDDRGDRLTRDHVDLIAALVDEALTNHPQFAHEWTYFRNLSHSLRKEHAKSNG